MRFPDVALQQVLAARSVHIERRAARPFCAHHQLKFFTTLQRKNHLCIPFLGIARPQSQFPHLCVCERFIYYQDRSAFFLCRRIGRSIVVGIYKSLTDTWRLKLRMWPRSSYFGNICYEFSELVLRSLHIYSKAEKAQYLYSKTKPLRPSPAIVCNRTLTSSFSVSKNQKGIRSHFSIYHLRTFRFPIPICECTIYSTVYAFNPYTFCFPLFVCLFMHMYYSSFF